jgi:hypothetical protein
MYKLIILTILYVMRHPCTIRLSLDNLVSFKFDKYTQFIHRLIIIIQLNTIKCKINDMVFSAPTVLLQTSCRINEIMFTQHATLPDLRQTMRFMCRKHLIG